VCACDHRGCRLTNTAARATANTAFNTEFLSFDVFLPRYPALYCTDGQPQDGGTPGATTTASLFIEIIDSPSFIQAESYRSCAHLAGHVHEQMLRYVDVGTSYFPVFVAEVVHAHCIGYAGGSFC
jgi:hypothetical protein